MEQPTDITTPTDRFNDAGPSDAERETWEVRRLREQLADTANAAAHWRQAFESAIIHLSVFADPDYLEVFSDQVFRRFYDEVNR